MERGIVVGGALMGASLVLAVVFNDIANRNAANRDTPSGEHHAEATPEQMPIDDKSDVQSHCEKNKQCDS